MRQTLPTFIQHQFPDQKTKVYDLRMNAVEWIKKIKAQVYLPRTLFLHPDTFDDLVRTFGVSVENRRATLFGKEFVAGEVDEP